MKPLLFSFLLALLPALAFAGTTASYPNVSAVADGDLFLDWQSSAQKNATALQLKTYVLADVYTKEDGDDRYSPLAGSSSITTLGSVTVGAVPWSLLTSTPTTLAGYGITDAYTKTASDALYSPLAGSSSITTLGSVTVGSVPWSLITSTPTTLAGYGITDAYTKTASDGLYAPITGSANYDAAGAATAAQTAAEAASLPLHGTADAVTGFAPASGKTLTVPHSLTVTGTEGATYDLSLYETATTAAARYGQLGGTNVWTGSNDFSASTNVWGNVPCTPLGGTLAEQLASSAVNQIGVASDKPALIGHDASGHAHVLPVATSRTINVSQADGDDTRISGISDFDRYFPFKTASAAYAEGVTIVGLGGSPCVVDVLDGAANINTLTLTTGVDIHLEAGASGGSFVASDALTGTDAEVTISGTGQSLNTSGGSITLEHPSTLKIVDLNLFSTDTTNNIATVPSGASLIVEGDVTGAYDGSGLPAGVIDNSGGGNVTVTGTLTAASGSDYGISTGAGKTVIGTLVDGGTSVSGGKNLTLLHPSTIQQSLAAPSTGFTQAFTCGPNDGEMDIAPSATLATGTETLPTDANSRTGEICRIVNTSAYTITANTVSVPSSGTIVGYTAGTVLAPGSISFMKVGANAWACLGSAGQPSGSLPADVAHTDVAQVFTAAQGNSTAGAASKPAMLYSGAPYTAGTATTNYPLVYLNQGTAPTSWATAGTELGINAPSGFTGSLIDIHSNGGVSIFRVSSDGSTNITNNFYATGTVTAGASQAFAWFGLTQMFSPSSGVIELKNAGGGFTRLDFGGTTSSFGALQTNGTETDSELADGSALAPFGCSVLKANIVSANSGSNAKAGTFTLVAGTATVTNTSITANSVVMVTVKTVGGTRTGNPDIVPTVATGFVATGGVADTSTYNYWIEENN